MKALFIKESLEKIQKFNKDDSVFGKLKIGNNPFNIYSSKYYINYIEPEDWDDIILDTAAELLGVNKNKIKVLSEPDESFKRDDLFFLPQNIALEIYEKDKNNIIEEKTIYRDFSIETPDSKDIKVYTFEKSSRNIIYVLLRKEDRDEFEWGIIILGAPDIFESYNFNRNLNPLDSLEIGMQSKKRLIDKMEESYKRGYFNQNKKDWGFSYQLWHSTLKKIWSPLTKIDILNDKIIIDSSVLKNDHLNLIVNCLNFVQWNWNLKAVSFNIYDKSVFTFVSPISESLNFNREGLPMEQMGIGKKEIDNQIIENTLWDNWTIEDLKKDNYEVFDLIKNYKGINILILEDQDDVKLPYIAVPSMVFTPRVNYTYFKTPEEAEKDTKSKIDRLLNNKLKESINFERKGNPLEKMDIGKFTIDREIIENTIWDGKTIDYYENTGYKVINLIRNYRGYPILILKDLSKAAFKLPYLAYSSFRLGTFYCKTPESAIKFIKEKMDKHLNLMGESINFERKGNPLEKMGIGKKAILKQKAAEIDWDWYDPKEKILKIFKYNEYWVKITRIIKYGKIKYRGISDCGEPYMDGPDSYDTSEEAEEQIKSWLTDW